MATQNSTGIPFNTSPPTADGQYWRSVSGLWIPGTISRDDISDATAYGRSLLGTVDSAATRLLLGVGQSTTQIIYGDIATTTNITIPTWAKRGRVCYVGAGGAAGSGSATTTTTLASGGGGGGAGGFYVDLQFDVDTLRSLWINASTPSPLVVTLGSAGIGGNGVTGTGSLVNGNPGTKGGDSSLTVNGVIFSRVSGGNFGSGGTSSGGAAGNNGSLFGGAAGANGGAGTLNTTGTAGGFSNVFDICGGGAGASGFSTGNASAAGGVGGRGGLVSRNPTEANPGASSNATPILVNGLPVPGNGAGAGSSNGAQQGGNGSNGGGGSGSSASRTASLKAGDGGRSWAIVEFFS
jgi:hypothetical protein